MTHGSLFSGIGGFDLAAEWMGWENKFHCEWNEFGQKVLKYYWPNAKSYGDITKTDFTIHRGETDVLTGGFPCQPFSEAGKRKGNEDERHLWPEMRRTIKQIQPSWVVGENVLGLLSWSKGLVFHEVQTDLEAEGFIMFPYVLPACGVNAPHKRDRIFFVAFNSINYGYRKEKQRIISEKATEQNKNRTPKCSTREFIRTDKIWNDVGYEEKQGMGRNDVAYPYDQGLQGSKVNGITKSCGENRNEQFARHVSSTWEKFPTQSPLCSRDDGLQPELAGITVSKHRTESIKGYGNAIVPQVAYEIFKAIEQYDQEIF